MVVIPKTTEIYRKVPKTKLPKTNPNPTDFIQFRVRGLAFRVG